MGNGETRITHRHRSIYITAMTTSDREVKRERTFPLGRIVMTAHAVNTIPFSDIANGLIRHAACDWGDIEEDDR